MAKKVIGEIKLQLPGGRPHRPRPSVRHWGNMALNIMDFCKAYNARTQKDKGVIIPVVITVYADRTYTFITKTPPASFLLRKAAGLDKGSGEPNRLKVGTVSMNQVEEIAKTKMPDLNADSLDSAVNTILGTARSMGIEVDRLRGCAMAQKGKKYREAAGKIERRPYPLEEAIGLVQGQRLCHV